MADTSRRSNAVAVLVLVAIGAVLLVWQRPWVHAEDPVVVIPANASAQLTSQFRMLTAAETESEFVSAAGASRDAHAFSRQVWRARQALGARDVELRYVGGGEVADRADGSASASVQVTWRPGPQSGLIGAASHSASIAFRVAPQSNGRFSIVGALPSTDDALPIWLAGAVSVKSSAGNTVIRLDGGDERLPVESTASIARAAVGRVVEDPRGGVTIVSAHTEAQMARIVGQPVAKISQIAAVTTSLDGRGRRSADRIIVLNPAVFATMDRRAAQIVVSHEATHLLTGAVGTAAESWVIEGFADFVALRDDSAPLSVSAGQILAQVKQGKLPAHLPVAGDFDAAGHGLGAVYESAWLIFRMLGERYDDATIERFYESVLGGARLEDAVQSSFGLTIQELTDDWRSYLSKSASTVS